MDAIGVDQETMHSIKFKKVKSLVLKVDLDKSYDTIN